MTLVIAILCRDAVVMGSDGAATFVVPVGTPTIRQPTHKLDILQNKIVCGTSGPVGLGQLVEDRIEKEWQKQGRESLRRCVDLPAAMRLLSKVAAADIGPALERAQQAVQLVGVQRAGVGALMSSLVALPVAGVPQLVHLDQQANPEAATEDLPFVAIGSAQTTADPFLAFLRGLFWPDAENRPALADGILAVTWTLLHAIDTTPGGIAEPIEVVVLEANDGDPRARRLEEDELQEARESVAEARQRLRVFREELIAPRVEEVEAPPEPE